MKPANGDVAAKHLTKREYFASQILAGLCARTIKFNVNPSDVMMIDLIRAWTLDAVEGADALLAALGPIAKDVK